MFADLVEPFLLSIVEAVVKSDQLRIFQFQSLEPSLMESLAENKTRFEGGEVWLIRAELGLRIGERFRARILEIFEGGLLRAIQIQTFRQPLRKFAFMRRLAPLGAKAFKRRLISILRRLSLR